MTFVRVLVAVTLLLAVVLAGCSGPPGLESDRPGSGGGGGGAGGDEGDPDDDPTGLPGAPRAERAAMLLDFDLIGCSGVETLGLLDAAMVQAVLPEGYEAMAQPGTAGGPVVPVQALWASCEALQTPTALVNDTVFGFVSVQIEPPAGALDADGHWYRLRMLAQDDVLALLWQAARYDVAVGAFADTSVVAGTPLGGTAPEDRDVGLGGYRVRGAATLSFMDPEVRSAHYTEVEGGRLEWTGEYTARLFRGMTATMEVPSDDPLADAWAAASTGTTAEPRSQRYLDAADWTGNDLWFRSPAQTP